MNRCSRVVAVTLALAAALVAPSGCKHEPRAGDACDKGRVCAAPDQALVCVDGHWLVAPCRGSLGCGQDEQGYFRCDISANRAGDACDQGGSEPVCTADGEHRVACKDRVVVVEDCDGPGGCTTKAVSHHASCNHIPRAGEACRSEGEDRCGGDHRSWLTCKSGVWVEQSRCEGKLGCQWTDVTESVLCDTGESLANAVPGARVDDPCERGEAERCASDLEHTVACRKGRWSVAKACRPSEKCGLDAKKKKVACLPVEP